MSTKIYNGFRFAQKDLRKVYEALHAYRSVICDDRVLAEKKFMAEQAVLFIDKYLITGTVDERMSTGHNPTLAAYCAMNARQRDIKRTGLRDPAVDFEFTVVVMPHKGSNYGIVYTDQSAWLKKFMKQSWVREYAYWNNSDPPQTITERAWAQRGKVWDAILAASPDDSPAGCGMVVEFGKTSAFCFTASDLLPHVPNRKTRAAWAASMYPNNKKFEFDPPKITQSMLGSKIK